MVYGSRGEAYSTRKSMAAVDPSMELRDHFRNSKHERATRKWGEAISTPNPPVII